jgi:type IV fimbrial biogenesis protein FimT
MKTESGFTLIELMMTLVVAAILLGLGVPSMKVLIQNGKITGARDDLRSALYLARSAAINENAAGCICPTDDALAAAPVCKGTGEWETGWVAFAEISDVSGSCVFDAGTDILLKVYDGSQNDPTRFTVRNDNVSINTQNYIRFNSRGAPVLSNGSIQQGVFTICDDRGVTVDSEGKSVARAIILSVSGSTRDTNVAAQITACPL